MTYNNFIYRLGNLCKGEESVLKLASVESSVLHDLGVNEIRFERINDVIGVDGHHYSSFKVYAHKYEFTLLICYESTDVVALLHHWYFGAPAVINNLFKLYDSMGKAIKVMEE